MFKYAKITLLTLVAFLLLGFTFTVNASPPWLEDKDQLLITPPLATGYYQIIYSNQSGATLEIDFDFFDFAGDSVASGSAMPTAGGVSWIAVDMNAVTGGVSYAHVSWFGRSDDLMVTVCTFDVLGAQTVKACVKAN